jgi:hypothetical protein
MIGNKRSKIGFAPEKLKGSILELTHIDTNAKNRLPWYSSSNPIGTPGSSLFHDDRKVKNKTGLLND